MTISFDMPDLEHNKSLSYLYLFFIMICNLRLTKYASYFILKNTIYFITYKNIKRKRERERGGRTFKHIKYLNIKLYK